MWATKSDLPNCEAPKCQEKAFMRLNGRWFCGKCSLKAEKFKSEKEDAYIMERFKKENANG